MNSNNNNLSDLKKLSKNWSGDQWENYLKSLESPCHELLIAPDHYNKLAQTKNISQIFGGLPLTSTKFRPRLSMKEALTKLSKNEKRVIVGLYWHDCKCIIIFIEKNLKGSQFLVRAVFIVIIWGFF